MGSVAVALPAGGRTPLRFACVDQRLIVWVHGKLAFGDGVEFAGPEKLKPHRENDLERPARLTATGGKVAVRHLRLFRDTYFRVTRGGAPRSPTSMASAPTTRTVGRRSKVSAVEIHRVPPDHYFVLGENSARPPTVAPGGPCPQRTLLATSWADTTRFPGSGGWSDRVSGGLAGTSRSLRTSGVRIKTSNNISLTTAPSISLYSLARRMIAYATVQAKSQNGYRNANWPGSELTGLQKPTMPHPHRHTPGRAIHNDAVVSGWDMVA